MKLRDYQRDALKAITDAFEDNRSTLAVMPTGTGKTHVFAYLIRDFVGKQAGGRAMVIAHRRELIYQAVDKIRSTTAIDCDIEMADARADRMGFFRSPVVVSSRDTLIAGIKGCRRLFRFDPLEFGLIVIDECFPAATIVDGRPISSFKTGDTIRTHQGTGLVSRVFRRRTDVIAKLTFASGRSLICTPNHPISTPEGFIAAGLLTSGSMVHTIIHHENEMCHLRNGDPNRLAATAEEIVRFRGLQVSTLRADHSTNLRKVRRRDHSFSQNERHVRPGNTGESLNQIAGHGLETGVAQRQWIRPDDPSIPVGISTRLALRSRNQNKSASQSANPSGVLQSGHRQRSSQVGDRSRRQLTLGFGTQSPGSKEARFLGYDRVDSVEIHQSTSGAEFERLCPAGLVYNLQVEPANTYFAEQILVHNCHHAPSRSYRKILEHFGANPNLRILGVTATPNRHDEKALGNVFDSVAVDYRLREAIYRDRWLVPIEQQFVQCENLDFSACRRTAGDLNGADLAKVMEEELPLQEVTQPTIDIIGHRKALVFAVSVAHAQAMTAIFNRHRPDCAYLVTAKTPRDERADILARYNEGDFQILCNVGIASEGFDIMGTPERPGIEVIVQARPTCSTLLYEQMIGRGTRTALGVLNGQANAEERRRDIEKSIKPSLLVLDFVGNSGRHKLVSSLDALGGDYEDDVIELAERELNAGEAPTDAMEILKRAERAAREARRRAEEQKRAFIKGRATYRRATVDPFDMLDISAHREKAWDKGHGATQKQLDLLDKWLTDKKGNPMYDRDISKARASQLIGELIQRRKDGKCTPRMVRVLRKYYGDEAAEMPMDKGKYLMDKLAANNWRPL